MLTISRGESYSPEKISATLGSPVGPRLAFALRPPQNGRMFKPGQLVRVNLAGMQVQGVLFHAAVTDAVGNIIKQTSEDPPRFLVKLLFSFKGVNEVEVPADRIKAN